MRRHHSFAVIAVLLALSNVPAQACISDVPIDISGTGRSDPDQPNLLSDIAHAQVVVIGRFSNYEIVPGRRGRSASSPGPDAPAGFWSSIDIARFDLLVDEVLVGSAPKTVTVIWGENSSGSVPETMPEGSYLFGLQNRGAKGSPPGTPRATILPDQEYGSVRVVQAGCSRPFLFPSNSTEARKVRENLKH